MMSTLVGAIGTGAFAAAGARRAGLAVALAVAALAAFSGPARAQIVYAHGGDLWVMNDDGSGQRQLLSAAQAGAAIDFANGGDQPVSVQPGGAGVAFVAPPAGSCGANVSNCPGVYSLVGGHVTRLTAPANPCGTVGVNCASEEEDPAITADGRVVYQRLDTASTFTCAFYCGFSGGYEEAYYVRRLDGSDAPLAWPVPPLAHGQADNGGVEPAFDGPAASDPADPSVLAYMGNYLNPGPNPGTPYYPLDIDHTAASPATVSQPSYDDSFIYGLAFSPDGSLLADIETGDHRGIWVYPSGQSFGTGTSEYHWALQDPEDGQGNSLTHFVSGLTFVGGGELVFSADYNLYSIPARCWTASDGTTAGCHFPGDATQLTSDGTQAAPDVSPAWTSATTPIPAYAVPGAAGPGTGGGTGGTGTGGTGGTGSGTTETTKTNTPATGTRPATRLRSHRINRRGRSATFSFTSAGAGAARFQCALVKQPRGRHHRPPRPAFARCSSPKTYRHLGRGAYTFYVRAVGAAGADLTPATVGFRV